MVQLGNHNYMEVENVLEYILKILGSFARSIHEMMFTWAFSIIWHLNILKLMF